MSRRRPIIGVTGPDRGGLAAWMFTWISVALAGGRAVWITPRRPADIHHLDGLVIGGGADVDPRLYGQQLMQILEDSPGKSRRLTRRIANFILFPLTWLIRRTLARKGGSPRDPLRDGLEMRLIHGAVKRGLPVLGICRGCQLLNVHFGGSLYQSILGFYTEEAEVRSVLPRKRVSLQGGLATVMGRRPIRVNALHRQAICSVGEGLRVAARDRNGIIQAIEHADLPFVIGVQWHPEYLLQMPRQRRLFAALIQEAERRTPSPRAAEGRGEGGIAGRQTALDLAR